MFFFRQKKKNQLEFILGFEKENYNVGIRKREKISFLEDRVSVIKVEGERSIGGVGVVRIG